MLVDIKLQRQNSFKAVRTGSCPQDKVSANDEALGKWLAKAFIGKWLFVKVSWAQLICEALGGSVNHRIINLLHKLVCDPILLHQPMKRSFINAISNAPSTSVQTRHVQYGGHFGCHSKSRRKTRSR